MERSDQELVTMYRRGNAAAFTTLTERHLGPIRYFIRRLTGDEEVANDLSQEVFVKVWRSLATYDTERRFTTWLYTIARRTVIDWSRKHHELTFSALSATGDDDSLSFEDTLPDAAPLPDAVFAEVEQRALIDAALETLSPTYREIVILHYFDALSFTEIAELTGRPLHTVKSQCRRGGLRLRAALQMGMHQNSRDIRI